MQVPDTSNMYHSPEEFRHTLREVAEFMSRTPESGKFGINLGLFMSQEMIEFRRKVTAAYVRNTMNRVQGVKYGGVIRVTISRDDGMQILVCEFVASEDKAMKKSEKEIFEKGKKAAEDGVRAETLKALRKFTPDIITLGADAAPIAVAVVELYRQFIDEMLEAGK